MVNVYQQGETLISNEVSPDELGTEPYEVLVPREMTTVSGVAGLRNCTVHGDTLAVMLNAEWDPVFAGISRAACDDDDCVTAIMFRKNYCEVNFIIVGLDISKGYPYDLRVSAEYSGMLLSDLSPVPGDYAAWATETNTGLYSVRVPRQREGSMTLELIDEAAGRCYLPEYLVYGMDLGARLAMQGYNWGKTDLDDVYVTLDFSMQDVEVEIRPWTGYDVEVEI